MKILTVERVLWFVLLVVVIATAIYGTNFVRDFYVYKEAADRCTVDKSVLHQELEQLDAQKAKVESEKEDLEQLPFEK